MPRRRVAIVTALCLAAALPATAQGAAPGGTEARADWRDPAQWKQLRLGMTRAQVVALLGEPGKTTRYYAFERWEYPDALGRRINFDETGHLSAWEPFAR